jgi:uncharacterized membrane protein YcaP (DUF421 family)
MHKNLNLVNHDEIWLLNELKKHKIDSPDKVLLASLNSDGSLYIDIKNKESNSAKVLE